MTWFKVDDSFYSHPKVIASELDAIGLWVIAGAWCGAKLTNGFVPDRAARWLAQDEGQTAAKLVAAGLWKRTKGGYEFHDWASYNPTRTGVDKVRTRWREQKRSQRERNSEKLSGKSETSSSSDAVSTVDTGVDSTTDSTRSQRGVQAPPYPYPNPQTGTTDVVPVCGGCGGSENVSTVDTAADSTAHAVPDGRRATRIPDDFAVTAAMVEWAGEHAPDVDGRRATAAFVDYWRAKAGAAATKRDWVATWRNWMRRDQEQAERSGSTARTNGTHPTDRAVLRLLAGSDGDGR